MASARKPRNGNGRNGDALRIPLPFDEAVKAALEAEPPETIERGKKARVASQATRTKS